MRALISCRILLVVVVLAATSSYGANLGPDDRQVSFTGPPGTVATDAVTPAVAFDSINQRYLTVWSADENDGDFQVYGQLLSGASGASISPAFVIGATLQAGTDNRQPAVAFDDIHQHYLVVWSSDAASPGAYEILGQLISVEGQLVGPTQRYSDMGTNDTDAAFDAVTPDLAWHPGLNSFVVVWAGDDDTGGLVDGRFEIYGQLVLGSNGAETGTNDFRISYAGPNANGNDATNPAVAVTSDPTRWFVAFEGDVVDNGIHEPEIFIYGGSSDVPDASAFAVSLMGGDYFDTLTARNPDLAWAESSGELVCVWDGQNAAGESRAIYGQRALPDGTLAGGLLSLSAWTAPMLREAIEPTIAVNPVTDAWFIAWRGDLDDGIAHYDHEIWASRFNDVGNPIDANAFTLSNMDPALGPVAGAGAPALAINATHGYKLVLWSGDLDSTPGGEHEIFVQGWADNTVSAVDDTPIATAFRLHGAVPNPFNPSTTIAFDLPAAAPVSLRIYDTAGRLVRTLLDGTPSLAGRNNVVWNGQDDTGRRTASGVYLYRLETHKQSDMGRMTLVK
jgi:FlgD Ig-like domain